VTGVRRLGPGDEALVLAAPELFDHPPTTEATARFLSSDGHHLFLAFDGERAVGMVTGVEMTHPDKGTEMFLYELGVAEHARGRGVGRALVDALTEVARAHGCYAMWVLTDDDNAAALATYRSAGAVPDEPPARMLTWDLSS
jgi:ribosomal protein S18 acetylase RimI-like enzyme